VRCPRGAGPAVFALIGVACGPARPPDILLVTVDTLRADAVGAYGSETARTPSMDGLAHRGTVFLQATTPFPRTTPGLASMMTGLWPFHHGSREVGRSMKELPTLASTLAGAGYETRGITANGSAGRSQNLHLGFEHFVDTRDFTGWRAENTTARALDLLKGAEQDKPLFFWVHYVDPHFPYEPPSGFPDQPRGKRCHKLLARRIHGEISFGQLHNDWQGLATAALDDCRGLYAAEVAYVDGEIARLLSAWDEARGRRGVVVLSSDHGENFGEDGVFYEHGPSVHDAALRVPLIVAGAGEQGHVDRGVARLEDLMPTLLSLARVPRERWPAMDGVDLSTRLRGGDGAGDEPATAAYAESGSDLLVESYRRVRSGARYSEHCVNDERFSWCEGGERDAGLYDHVADPSRQHDVATRHPDEVRLLKAVGQRWPLEETRQRSVRTPRFKLVAFPRAEGYETRLYDLEADPGETRDVSAQHPTAAEGMRRALDTWAAGIAGAGAGSHTPEQLEALRALGYIE
jgi:arylsulfatase A-like enzyme